MGRGQQLGEIGNKVHRHVVDRHFRIKFEVHPMRRRLLSEAAAASYDSCRLLGEA
jgi:hypothetical protein